jgi:glycopeptide antibiotics resistance protein
MTIYCLLIVAVILYNDLDAVIFLLCGIATGTPIYIIMNNIAKYSKYPIFRRLSHVTVGLQKLLMVVSPDASAQG